MPALHSYSVEATVINLNVRAETPAEAIKLMEIDIRTRPELLNIKKVEVTKNR